MKQFIFIAFIFCIIGAYAQINEKYIGFCGRTHWIFEFRSDGSFVESSRSKAEETKQEGHYTIENNQIHLSSGILSTPKTFIRQDSIIIDLASGCDFISFSCHEGAPYISVDWEEKVQFWSGISNDETPEENDPEEQVLKKIKMGTPAMYIRMDTLRENQTILIFKPRTDNFNIHARMYDLTNKTKETLMVQNNDYIYDWFKGEITIINPEIKIVSLRWICREDENQGLKAYYFNLH